MAKKKQIQSEIASAASRYKPPGLKRREEEYASALKERSEFEHEAGGSPITGNVSTKKEVEKRRRALLRQQAEAKRRGL